MNVYLQEVVVKGEFLECWRINSSLQRGDQPVFVAHLREADGGLSRLSRLCGARRRQSDFLRDKLSYYRT